MFAIRTANFLKRGDKLDSRERISGLKKKKKKVWWAELIYKEEEECGGFMLMDYLSKKMWCQRNNEDHDFTSAS